MADSKKPHRNDWVVMHNPAVPGPDAKVQRKSFEAVWGVPVDDGGPGFKLGPRPDKKAGS